MLCVLGFWVARAPVVAVRDGASEALQAMEPEKLEPAERRWSATPAERTAIEATPEDLAARPAAPAEPLRLPALVVTGRVVDRNEQPIEGADVFVGAPWEGETQIATTDARGAFAASLDERPREYAFCVVADGYEGERRFLSAEVSGSDVRGTELRLGTFRLGPGGEVRGQVLDEAGGPVAKAWVQWYPASAFPRDSQAARENGLDDDQDRASQRFHALGMAAADGTYYLRGLPPIEGFLAAAGAEKSWGWTPLFTPGPELEELEIVLPPPKRPSSSILGVVQDPEGVALGQVVLRLKTTTESTDVFVTPADGYFRVEPGERATVGLIAFDSLQRFAPVRIDEVAPGTRGLVLRLGPPDGIAVRLVDAGQCVIPGGSVVLDGYQVDAGADGLVRVQRPIESFELGAWAPGFLPRELGRLDPANLGAEIVVKLEPGPALRGRVIAGGAPVSGAHVALAKLEDPGSLREARGLAPLDHPFQISGSVLYPDAEATTDAQGHFVFSLEDEGELLLGVGASGHPFTVFGPFASERVQTVELALTLESAGALEGRVRRGSLSHSAERLVAASDGHGFAWTAPVREDGTYRIDGLPPGSFQVRPCEPPAASLQPLEEGPDASEPLVWDCVVRAGETTRFDLDVTDENSVVLAGELDLPGAESGNREAVLLPAGAPPRSRSVRAHATLDADGCFELGLARPGEYVLEIRTGWLVLSEPLNLPTGRTEWRRSFLTGTLHVRVPAAAELKAPRATLRYSNASGRTRFTAELDTYWSADVSFVVPTGKARLELFPEKAAENAWPNLREIEIELEPGEEVLVTYP